MTGYGRGTVRDKNAIYVAECSSINRKQAEIATQLPREIANLEPRVRQLITERIHRGRISISIAIQNTVKDSKSQIDLQSAKAFYQELQQLSKALDLQADISLDLLLRNPNIFKSTTTGIDSDAVWPKIERAIHLALDEMIAMKAKEGLHLARDVTKRIKLIRGHHKQISKLAPDSSRQHRENLLRRLQNIDLGNSRLLEEVAIYADRCDISEELTRLESHFVQFEEKMKTTGPIAKSLEFLCQEIFRELNTVGSKSNDAAISQLVVNCKTELDRIREQLSNLE